MTHLSEEQLVDAYYGEFDASGHLPICNDCQRRFDSLKEVLDSIQAYSGPECGPSRVSKVWRRLLPKLATNQRRRWWVLTPALAALLVVAFFTGRWTGRTTHPAAISDKARERVLLISLSEHLEQSQIVLQNVENSAPGPAELMDERDRAHELLGANRLLRQTAERVGDFTDMALLDDLERVLLDVANTPINNSPAQMAQIQQRIEHQGLLFRVRITSMASRERGQKL